MKRLSLVLSALMLSACHGAASQALTRTRRDGARVYAEGTLRLSGNYVRRQDATTLELQGDQLCFHPDQASAHLIPRGSEDQRSAWFCFSNRERALALLAVPTSAPEGSCGVAGTATILVSHYMVDRAETAAFDTAQLDEVTQASAPAPLECPELESPPTPRPE